MTGIGSLLQCLKTQPILSFRGATGWDKGSQSMGFRLNRFCVSRRDCVFAGIFWLFARLAVRAARVSD